MNRTEDRSWDDDSLRRQVPPAQPPGWTDPPLRFDDEGTLIPPRRPQPALIDDGYYVEAEPVRRPYEGWDLEEPISHRLAWLGLGICIGIIVFALVWTLGRQFEAASSSGQTTEPVDVSGLSSAALSPAPTSHAAGAPRSEAPVPSSAGAAPSDGVDGREMGWAAWCAPTATRCQSWGPPALLGAVASFTDGDRPYPVRVHRVDDPDVFVDVTVVSFCACGIRGEHRTVIDLSPAAFDAIGDLSEGIVLVELEVLPGAGPTLPPTDVPDQSSEDPPEHPDDARMRLEDRDR